MKQIKNRFTGEVIFESSIAQNTRELVEEAVRKGVSLSDADLKGADLENADLRNADLRFAELEKADLTGAFLTDADLGAAYLGGADLAGADLRDADLSRANLEGAYLRGADLSRADLEGAYLSGACLADAQLSSVRGLLFAAATWSGHGECGRQLLAVDGGDGPVFHCGCFRGTRDALLVFIKEDDPDFFDTRMLTLEVVDMLLAMNKKVSK